MQIIAPGDGYVTAYVGNESDADVFFDDVTVVHGQGLQVQETEYDPTGLELAGLGSSTPGLKRLNQYRWNGKELRYNCSRRDSCWCEWQTIPHHI